MSSDKFHCTNGNCLTDCALSSIDYDADFPPRFCPHSGVAVCWKKRETTKKKPSLFDKITVSPEVLAEKLVYEDFGGWWSVLFDDDCNWDSRAEAIAATAAKLKGGADD